MKKLIYAIAAVAVAVPVVALAQSACNSGSCTKGDKDMAEAKALPKSTHEEREIRSDAITRARALKDAYEKSKEAVKDTYQDSKEAVDHAADRAADKAEAIGDAAKNG